MYPYVVIGRYYIPSYYLCALAGFLIAFIVISRILINKYLFGKYIKIYLYSFIGMGIGARILGIISGLLYYHQVNGKWSLISAINSSGIVFIGGLIGYMVNLFILCKIKRESFLVASDIASIGIPLFHSFGRIGCFLSGCCYGKLSDSKLAIPYRIYSQDIYMKRIPVQIYESIFEFLMFILMYFLFRNMERKNINNKNLISIYILLYGIWRFFIEFYRGDEVRYVVKGISITQIIIVISIIIITLSTRRKNYNERKH